jgi:S-DNA-T family DNA segregation ATPase FtsK/SpoIIIE
MQRTTVQHSPAFANIYDELTRQSQLPQHSQPPQPSKAATWTRSPEAAAFNRPPRILVAPPQETVEIPRPPRRETIPPGPSWLSLFLPLLSVILMLAIYLVINHSSPQELVFLLPIAVFAVMTPISTMLSTYQRRRAITQQNRENERKYRAALQQLREKLSQQRQEQRRIALLTDPYPIELEQRIIKRAQLWERRPTDPDFLAVRVGSGARPFSVTLKMPELDVTDELTPEIQALQQEFRVVEDLPCTVSLPKVKSLGITGRRQDVAALTRAILCQIATLHAPEDVRILGIYPASQRRDWDWLRALPHTMPLKGWKCDRLTAVGEDEATMLLNMMLEELSQRASKSAEQQTDSLSSTTSTSPQPLPHLVVIVHDYVEVRRHPALTHAFKLGEQLGVSVIYLVAQQQAIPSECRGVAWLAEDNTLTYAQVGAVGDTLTDVRADLLELEYAERISRSFSTIVVADEDDADSGLPTNVRLLDLLAIAHADEYRPNQWWNNGAPPRFGHLRVPIGMGLKGPLWLDLNESAHGPHGIIAGTTGAGKSELLQTLILGLAVTHHPHLVNFVLVDFKGGAAFKPFEKIPHTVGLVTDLSGKLTERALVALKSELRRREHILSQANVRKIAEYQALHRQHPAMYEPLPELLIIIDEFAELAKEHPTFMEGLVSIVQKGRSLGVHLILATQKPTGSVNASIWSNLKFRICLRVASLQDSRDMLGRSEAALLPSTIPGRAYFQIGSEIFELFQSARVTLPAQLSTEKSFAPHQHGSDEATDQSVLIDALAPYQESLGAELFRPWPAPLPHRISLNEVYRLVQRYRPQQHNEKLPPYGWLACPLGMIDFPAEQRQEPWILALSERGGHVLIAGAAGSGKSTLLRTLITSLVHTHSPTQLHLYLIDFGGQALRVFEQLPHVGGFFTENDGDYIQRLLRKLEGIIDERKRECATRQIDDFLAYQRRRLDDSSLPAMPAVMLFIDGFMEFKQAYEREMEHIITIARQGRSYGVYLVLTLDRPVALSTQLMSLIELRIGLRLVETTDSLVLLGRYDAAHIDPALPGRGYIRGKTLAEVQVALPTPGEDDDEQTRQLDSLVTLLSQNSNVPPHLQAPPIKLLPDYVSAETFLNEALALTAASAPPLPTLRPFVGIEDFSLHPIVLELSYDTPHALIAGGPGSGRTNLLQMLLLTLSCPAYQYTRLMLVDLRRNSRSLRRLPHLRYVDNEERLNALVDDLKSELRQRIIQLQEETEQLQDEYDDPVEASMTPLVLFIDDYDQLAALSRNPLHDLKEFLLKARELHLHLIVAGTPGDLMRSDPLLQQARTARLGIVLSGDSTEPPVFGVRLSDLPPGRGHLVRRNQKSLVQFAHIKPEQLNLWLARLAPAKLLSQR